MMVLCDEAITVQTMAPLEAHVAAFISVWHLKPNTGDGELHTPPQQTPPSVGTLHHLHAKLGDLNDHELQQLVKDLMQEIVQCKLAATPSNPPPNDWVCPSGSREPKEDDQEVTFPGGGKVGSREANHPSSRVTSWGKSSLWTTAAIAMSCTSRTRHGVTNHHPNLRSAHWHPKNKHLQWQHGAW